MYKIEEILFDKSFSSEQKIQAIFDYLTDFIVLCNSDSEIIESNKSANVVLGLGESIAGSKCYEILREKKERCLNCPLSNTIKSGTIIPVTNYDKRFGEYFEERTHPIISDDGELQGYIIVIRNVSKSLEIEEKSAQLKKLVALGRISSGVAHDFNNVLTGVLGRVQLMKMSTTDPYLSNSLDMIEKSALDGAAKVRRIQDFSRAKRGDISETIDLNQLIKDVVDLTKPKWNYAAILKGIIIKLVVELSENLYILGDQSELRNAFTNLIFNAVEAMPEGGIITISAEKRGDRIAVMFKDVGIGMTEETVEKVFDPFFSTKGGTGTGLGMSEVYGVVQRHSGQIDVNSKVGQGTTITITFPAVKKEEDKFILEKPIERLPNSILVIDDEEYILDLLSELLGGFGLKVDAFSSAAKALAEFNRRNYDIVITDLGMPEMSGHEVASKIKGINSATQVILLSGWTAKIEEDHVEDAVDFLLHKPFSMEEIECVVSEAISKTKKLNSEKGKDK